MTHPSGWIYFVNSTLNVVTDDDIRDPNVLSALSGQMDALPALPPGCEVHLHTKAFLTIFVNHERALSGYSPEVVHGPHADNMDPESLLRLRRLYWSFLQQHPCHMPLPPCAEDELLEALTNFRTENIMFDQLSPSPFSDSELDSLLELLSTYRGIGARAQSPVKTTFVAWVLRRISSHREATSYGRYTRKFYDDLLLSKQSQSSAVQDSPLTRNRILNAISDLFMTVSLWSVPSSYLNHVRSAIAYRGRLSAVQNRWEAYISKLVKEWNDFNLVATVLLSATVSFLSVPGLDEISSLFCMTSVLLSLGSLVIGVFCVWKHQSNIRANDSFRYMHNAQNSIFGLRGLAILLSLPLVLLIWAIICFACAVVVYAFRQLPEGEEDPLRGTGSLPWGIAGAAALVASVVLGAVWSICRIWMTRSTLSLYARLSSFLPGRWRH